MSSTIFKNLYDWLNRFNISFNTWQIFIIIFGIYKKKPPYSAYSKNINRVTHYTLNCRVSTTCKTIFLFIISDKLWGSPRIWVEVWNTWSLTNTVIRMRKSVLVLILNFFILQCQHINSSTSTKTNHVLLECGIHSWIYTFYCT